MEEKFYFPCSPIYSTFRYYLKNNYRVRGKDSSIGKGLWVTRTTFASSLIASHLHHNTIQYVLFNIYHNNTMLKVLPATQPFRDAFVL